ncbi:MAG: peptidoglycan -binding protein [Hyphomicrobiales bacterium]|nr:peptidoglycan -binding protein [Hyphomicrobiales bacterium]MCP5371661.1 peptidoglycan -binding protein [Hyphomicrobiales bacterium]
MPSLSRRSQYSANTWPGFVDALATMLMVIIFVLMIFVLAQFFLGEALTGRDQALQRLQDQVGELAELLALERRANSDLRLNVAQLSEELQASVAKRDDLAAAMQALSARAERAEAKSKDLEGSLADAFETMTADKETIQDLQKTVAADKETIELKVKELATLANDIASLKALREELEKKIVELATQNREAWDALTEAEKEKTKSADALALSEKEKKELLEALTRAEREKEDTQAALRQAQGEADKNKSEHEKALAELLSQRKLSDSAQAQVALLNKQLAALREQLAQLSKALDVAEAKAEDQGVQIATLTSRLNAALATKVQELSRYRSEFFGRLREVLGGQQGVRIVGDRFVFQSEVLFASGSADIEESGQAQMRQLAASLKDLITRMPKDIDWVLRVDGHTDNVPISNQQFPSNWELSSARAISVVKFLIDQGIPAHRLVAAGFGEYQPLDERSDEIGRRRNRRIEFKLTQR